MRRLLLVILLAWSLRPALAGDTRRNESGAPVALPGAYPSSWR